MVFVYKVTAECTIEKIPRNKRHNVLKSMNELNEDVFGEYFYEKIGQLKNKCGFTSSGDTDIEFHFDLDKHSYTLYHVCYHEKDTMLDHFKSMYDKEDFDLTELFFRSGCNDIYSNFSFKEIVPIKGSIELYYEIMGGTADDEDDYFCEAHFDMNEDFADVDDVNDDVDETSDDDLDTDENSTKSSDKNTNNNQTLNKKSLNTDMISEESF